MLRHKMQAYKPKQAVCEAMLLCVRSTFKVTSVSTVPLPLRYLLLMLYLGPILESTGPIFILIVWSAIFTFHS